VLGLVSLGEAGDATRLAQGAETVSTPGYELVHVALVPHVPDDLVPRAVVNTVQRQGQLDDPEVGREMPSRL